MVPLRSWWATDWTDVVAVLAYYLVEGWTI
jgi:hypothetical protein